MKSPRIPVDTHIPPFSIWGLVPHIVAILASMYMAYFYFSSGISATVNTFVDTLEKKYDTTCLSPVIGIIFPLLFGGAIPLTWLVWLVLTKIMRDPIPPQDYTRWVESAPTNIP